jgi:hypothetical protein
VALLKDAVLQVAMPNRKPRIAFDRRLFVLPHGQTPVCHLTTINLSTVALQLIRLTERNVAAFLTSTRLGDAVDVWNANNLADQSGSVVWQGKADIPKWQANKPARTALPIPDALATAGPGLYALVVQPGDGTDTGGRGGVQIILRTDLAPTIWRGSDGLTEQMRSYTDAKPRAGVKLRLLAHNNDILAETTTDADGFGRFPAPLRHGAGPLAPAALHAFGKDGDFAALDLNVAAFDLSDRGVDGQPHPGPLDAFVWLDRGIYRPGETVQMMALLRDAAGLPADFPAEIKVKRPNGQVFLKTSPARAADASIHLPVTLSAGAGAGTWVVEVRSDPNADPISRAEFRVEHGGHVLSLPLRLGGDGQPRRARKSGCLGRPPLRPGGRKCQDPYRATLRRRGEPAGAVGQGAVHPHTHRPRERHRCRCSRGRKLGSRRLCRRPRLPRQHRHRRFCRPARPRHRPYLGRRRSHRTYAPVCDRHPGPHPAPNPHHRAGPRRAGRLGNHGGGR